MRWPFPQVVDSDLLTLFHHKATAALRANIVLEEEIAIGPL